MTPSKSFPKTHRIGGRGRFLPIREKGSRVTSGPLVAWAIVSERKYSRLGISIGRMVGNAVMRNRIKRQLREAFRNMPPAAAVDLVIQVRKHDPAQSSEYREWWRKLLERMERNS